MADKSRRRPCQKWNPETHFWHRRLSHNVALSAIARHPSRRHGLCERNPSFGGFKKSRGRVARPRVPTAPPPNIIPLRCITGN